VTDEILDLYFGCEIGINIISGLIVEQLPSDVNQEGFLLPEEFKLEQNFPNPFNGMTTIKFNLASNDKVSFQVYNLLGENIFFKELGELEKGAHHFNWVAEDNFRSPLCSGIYFYQIKGTENSDTKKLVLLR